MLVGNHLKRLREAKNLSQGDIEKRAGLLRCYVSRVENGHTVPSVGTLEKFALALKVPLYQLVYDGEEPPVPPQIRNSNRAEDLWASSPTGSRLMQKLLPLLAKMNSSDRKLVLLLAGKTSKKRKATAS